LEQADRRGRCSPLPREGAGLIKGDELPGGRTNTRDVFGGPLCAADQDGKRWFQMLPASVAEATLKITVGMLPSSPRGVPGNQLAVLIESAET
jgi:hypothetical protein